MRQPSSTSSFRKLIFIILTFVTVVFILDRLAFKILFPIYDNWFRVESTLSPNEILVVGSSHIESDVDAKLLSQLTGKGVGLFSLPGAGTLPRYYGIKERLDNKNLPLPKIIILETSPLVFHKSRYFDDESVPLIPYFHRGQFLDYVNKFGPLNSDWIWRKLFWTYSLNTYFDRITDPANIFRYFAEKILSPQKYLQLRNKFRTKQVLCTGNKDERVQEWWNTKQKMGLENQIDDKKLEYFKETMELVSRYPIKVFLLDPPFFHFKNENIHEFDNVRNVLKSFENKSTKFLSLKFENDPCLFNDGGHIGSEGQNIFTRELANEVLTLH